MTGRACLAVIAISAALAAGCATGGALDPAFCRGEMKSLVQRLAAWSRGRSPGFLIVPQNGHDLLTVDGDPDGPLDAGYVGTIDGLGREELNYGYDGDGVPTPADERARMERFLDRLRAAGRPVLVIDYCNDGSCAEDAVARAEARGYLEFAADHRQVDDIPRWAQQPRRAFDGPVRRLADARNFLYVLNLSKLGDRTRALATLQSVPHDVLVIDPDVDGVPLTRDEVASLRRKPGGGRRLVLAYVSIGEAERYRPYWNPSWDRSPPRWLADENPRWPGNYKVRYWDRAWQSLVFGEQGSELQRIIDAGFDGAWLDVVDAYEFFERDEE